MNLRSLTIALCLAIATLLPTPAAAHPVPNDQYDRKIQVHLKRTAENEIHIRVVYRLEIDETTAVRDLVLNFSDQIDVAQASDKRAAFYATFTKLFAPIFADNLSVKVNNKYVPLKVATHSHYLVDEKGQPLGHLRCDFELTAALTVETGQSHQIHVQEDNFFLKTGLIDLALVAAPSVPLQNVQQAGEALKQKPLTELGPGDEQVLRSAAAAFTLPASVKPVQLDATAKEGEGQVQPLATGHKEETPLLDLFFNSDYSVWLLIVLALLFGAVHALTPGHGKTLMAAYLVGEQGTITHALVLGLVTTLTHTGAVILVAIALRFVSRENILFALDGIKLLFGLLIVGIGVWLLLCRLSGRADHVHIGGGHHHHHHGPGHHHHHDHSHADHDHDAHGHLIPRKPGEKVSVWRLMVLGMQGGIVPCWDAVVMLFLAVAANLLWLALPLLLAFSAGLAGVLVLIGIAVVTVKQFAQSRWGESRLVKALPVLSACIVIGLGLWLCYVSVHGQESHPPRGQVNASR